MNFIIIKIITVIIYFFVLIQNVAYSYIPNSDILKNNNNLTFSVSSMLEKVIPSVVSVYTSGTKIVKSNIPKEFKYFFDHNFSEYNKKYFEGLGSGVIIDANNGYIITNNHVINDANKIKIKLNNGEEYKAKLIGKDKKTDLAVLKILVSNNIKLTEIKLSNSDNVKVGDFTIAIGNPFGLGQTVTSGIISAIGRSGLNIIEGLENFIQTDASINKGNSGGALININGELIGINTAILAPNGGNIGIGFAIPSNIIKKLSEQLIKYGKIKRGYLGIKGTELTKNIAKALKIDIKYGAFVSEVIPQSPAEKYGIKSGDVIISINDKIVKNFLELKTIINITSIEQNIKINIIRNNKEKIIFLKLSKLYNENIKVKFSALKGLTIIDSVKNNETLVKIIKVNKNSKADKLGFKIGDFIIGVNSIYIKNVKHLKEIFKKNITITVVYILRNYSKIFILIK